MTANTMTPNTMTANTMTPNTMTPNTMSSATNTLVAERARHRLAELTELAGPRTYGYVSRVVGLSITVSGLTGRIGDLLTIGDGPAAVLAEVVAVDQQHCT